MPAFLGNIMKNRLCDLQVYSNLSNCNYRIFVKKILLEIGFIEETRTTWGNKKVPQTFFQNFLYLQKNNLIHLTPNHWQLLILEKLWHNKEHNFAKILAN